jgi:alanyl-tRNA synthetase
VDVLDGWDAAGLKELAAAIAARAGHVAILFTASSPMNVAIARAVDVDVDAAAILRALTSRFGGKGGGRADLAQGGGLSGDAAQIVEFARTAL